MMIGGCGGGFIALADSFLEGTDDKVGRAALLLSGDPLKQPRLKALAVERTVCIRRVVVLLLLIVELIGRSLVESGRVRTRSSVLLLLPHLSHDVELALLLYCGRVLIG